MYRVKSRPVHSTVVLIRIPEIVLFGVILGEFEWYSVAFFG